MQSFKIDIGECGRNKVTLDASTLIDTRLLIQANSGGGKSWLFRRLAERTAERVQIIVIDWEGEFVSLREKIDLVIVGAAGEIPASIKTAGKLGRRLVDLGVNAVIDLSDLELAHRRQYVKDFLSALMAVPRKSWHPLIVAIDEAHMLCPERGSGEACSTGAVISLMSQGRKRGFSGVLLTQRLSKLHKDAAAEANNVFIGRTALDVDQRRAGDVLGLTGKDDRIALRDLEPGEFIAYGPALSFNGAQKFKVGAVATTHPKAGARGEAAPPAPSNKVKHIVPELEAALNATSAEPINMEQAIARIAELERGIRLAKAGDPELASLRGTEVRELRNQIASLERRLKTDVEAAVRAYASDAYDAARDLQERQRTDISAAVKLLEAWRQPKMAALLQRDRIDLWLRERTENAPAPSVTEPKTARVVGLFKTKAANPMLDKASPSGNGLGKCARELLRALGAAGTPMTRQRLALRSGYSPKKSTLRNALTELRGGNYIVEAGDTVQITDTAVTAYGPFEPLPTGQALIEHWLSELGSGSAAGAIYNELTKTYPSFVTRSEAAERAGYDATKSTLRNALTVLRGLGLIEERGDELRLSEELFA